MKKNWILPKNREIIDYLAAQLNLDRHISASLANRNIMDLKSAKEFLYPDLNFTDAFEIFSDMEKAVSIISEAVSKKQKIAVLADSDADGISGLLIIEDALADADTSLFVCEETAYGIGKKDIERILASGAAVLITVDVGISQKEELDKIRSRGIKVVICDHHQPPEIPPMADAIIDPACEKNNSQMSASLVAFYLGCAIILARIEGFGQTKITCDVETTGMSAATHQIIEIGAVKFRGFKVLDTFSSFVKPSRSLSPEITYITGIKNRDLEDAPPAEEVFEKFAEWIGDSPMIFHNAPFDVSFLSSAFKKYLGRDLDNKILDTLVISRKMYPSMSHRLEALKEFFNIKNPSHRALPDADTTFRIYNILRFEKNSSYRVFVDQNLPLAAIGTLSDSIPLLGKSRWVVKEGIKKLPKTKRFVFRMLFSELGIRHPDDCSEISFKLIPFINTPKRMAENRKALELFAAKKKKDAKKTIDYISALSRDRKNVMRYDFESVEKAARRESGNVIILRSEEIPPGFRGVFAGRLAQTFRKPTILFTHEGNFWVGSARASFDILSVFSNLGKICEAGGHMFACGVKVANENFGEFEAKLRGFFSGNLLPAKIKIDGEWDEWFEKNYKSAYEIFSPFGAGNPYFKILNRNLEVQDISEKQRFYLLRLKKDDKVFNILSREEVPPGFFDFVFHIERNNGKFYFFLDDYEKAEGESKK
ncbi:MAG: 3'-5' exoribonuclease [Elusimicrobia bacterium]|nr:3'-5' exoribonuclease [Elusimicrobiota bacterium]